MGALLGRAAARLAPRAGDRSAGRLEAEVLLAHALGVGRGDLLLRPEVPAPVAEAFEALVDARVATGRPVAYLTGERGFYDLDLLVDERVLVPRPETEHVVTVLLELEAAGRLPPGPVVDRGTGSGALALALAGQLRGRLVAGLDLSAGALEVAAANAARCGRPLRLLRADGLSACAGGRWAAVVANPPYVRAEEHETLPADVRDHEPRGALVPGEGSVEAVYARLAAEAARVLVPGGWLVTEMGLGQTELVTGACRAAGLEVERVEPDLAGIPRVVAARAVP